MPDAKMSQLSKLMQVTECEKKKILGEFKITEEELVEKVEILKTWIRKNEHFPADTVFNDHQLRVLLVNGKMSLERAKQSLEGYLMVKKLYQDLFEKLIPNEEFDRVKQLSTTIVMPKLLPNLCRLYISRVNDTLGMALDGFDYYVMPLMIAELVINNDFFLSSEILVDMQHFNIKNLLKFTPNITCKLGHLFTAIRLRVNRIHMINTTALLKKCLAIVKPVLPPNVYDKIVIHQTLEELHKYIPKEYLPSNYGGTEKSLEEYHDMWLQEIVANGDFLKEVRNLRLKELIKPIDMMNEFGMGSEGSFKRLMID